MVFNTMLFFIGGYMLFVFDVDDTLYGQMDVLLKAMDKEFGKDYVYPFDRQQFYAVCREYGEKVFPKVVAGEMSVDECGVYRLRKAFEDFKVTVEEDTLVRIHQNYAYNQAHIQMDEDKKEVLEYLVSKNANLALLTNGPSEHQRKKIQQLGLYAYFEEERVFVSGEVGISKPNIGIFEHIERKCNANKEELIYIGDSLENDVIGAKKAGWKVIWINRRNVKLADDFAYMPEHIVTSEDSLLTYVKKYR